MIHFNQGEPVNIPNAIVMTGGDYQDSDLVPVCKWDSPTVLYTQVQAYFLKWGQWL